MILSSSFKTPTTSRFSSKRHVRGFTLVELLVVIAIIAIMASLTMTVMTGVQEKRRSVEATGASRNLISAYLLHASENNGQFMACVDRTSKVIYKEDGTPVNTGEQTYRWTLRLPPYYQYQYEPVIFTPQIVQYLEENGGSGFMGDYMKSITPRFGMNEQFVGGLLDENGNMSSKNAAECAGRLTDVPTAIIAFVSSDCSFQGDGFPGYFKVRPPNEESPYWGQNEWNSSSNPQEFGYIDASFGNKAVCAYTDGTVRLHDMDELKDMRLWSKNAVAVDDKDYLKGKAQL